MWNIFFIGFILTPVVLGDVSHLTPHQGYPVQKPDNQLQLPSGSQDSSVTGYPKKVPQIPFQTSEGYGHGGGAGGNYGGPDGVGLGSNIGGVRTRPDQDHDHSHDPSHDHHHYHGEDGKYNPHDDGKGWDIRKSVPGEPGRDYPVHDRDAIPTTSFTCKDKGPGYYADEEAGCQVFRVCTTHSLRTHYNFLCANGTLFNQRSLTCDWWMNVDCAASSEYFYTNAEIGKMPTGQELMRKITQMIEAPKMHPYDFNQDQQNYLENMQQESQARNDYLTTTTTPKPKPVPEVILNNVDKNPSMLYETAGADFFNRNVTRQEMFANVNNNEYIPPVVPDLNLGKVATSGGLEQNASSDFTNLNGLNQLMSANVANVNNKGYLPPVVPDFNLGKVDNTGRLEQNASSDFTNLNGLNQLMSANVDANRPPTIPTKSSSDISTDVPTTAPISFITKVDTTGNQGILNISTDSEFSNRDNFGQSSSGTAMNNAPVPQESGSSDVSVNQNQEGNKIPTLTVTNEKTHTITHNEKTTHVFENFGDGPNKVPFGLDQKSRSDVQTTQPKTPKLTNEQSQAQIDKIVKDYEALVNEQQLSNFGAGLINPRMQQNVPTVNFQPFVQTVQPVQSIPVYTPQVAQPIVYTEYPGHPQNKEVVKDGHSHNYEGKTSIVHSGGKTDVSFHGKRLGFKETTHVDIVPSLGYHLNDEYEKNSYISALLQGYITDVPTYHIPAQQQFVPTYSFPQSQFVPSDARFSSYHGTSSYLAPQGSVQRLPSDSGYHYR